MFGAAASTNNKNTNNKISSLEDALGLLGQGFLKGCENKLIYLLMINYCDRWCWQFSEGECSESGSESWSESRICGDDQVPGTSVS